jgi:hypothetical protein
MGKCFSLDLDWWQFLWYFVIRIFRI